MKKRHWLLRILAVLSLAYELLGAIPSVFDWMRTVGISGGIVIAGSIVISVSLPFFVGLEAFCLRMSAAGNPREARQVMVDGVFAALSFLAGAAILLCGLAQPGIL